MYSLLLLCSSAQALTIELIDEGDTTMNSTQRAAFEAAATIWENAFSDPITVKINVGWSDAGSFSSPNVLAKTHSARTLQLSGIVKTALIHDGTAVTEINSYKSLPSAITVADINGNRDDRYMTITRANSKALNLPTGLDPAYGSELPNNADASIIYNNNFAQSFDLDRSDGISYEKKDFIGVAAHEIGHALGFISVTDAQDKNPGLTLHPSTLDYWRRDGTGGAHSKWGYRVITAADTEYYDRDLNNVPLSAGMGMSDSLCENVDGKCQASHWRDDQGNLMDPTVKEGVWVNATGDDLHALDFIGYDRISQTTNSQVPVWWIYAAINAVNCRTCVVGSNNKNFDDLPAFPNLTDVNPPFKDANYSMHFSLKTNSSGLRNRSVAGYVRFVPVKKNPDTSVV